MSLKINGKILWTGSVEVVTISSEDLKKLGWTDEMIEDFVRQIEEDINH